MKDAPAIHQKNYSISTALTGDSGEAFLAALNPAQREQITSLVELQRQDLQDIVSTRRAIATELRQFLAGGSASKENVLDLCRHYGELDGELSYYYATHFAEVNKTLTGDQRAELEKASRHRRFQRAKAPLFMPIPSNRRQSRTRISCLSRSNNEPKGS